MTCVETGYVSLNKYGEELCGDRVETCVRDGAVTMVLADGLGSGVKANILSSLTSKILCTMIAEGMRIADAVQTIAQTLPECSVRHIAYSTFTVLNIKEDGETSLIQFDNPRAIYMHEARRTTYPVKETEIYGKKIYETGMKIKENDMILLLSDGVVHAGIGRIYNQGWQYDNVCGFVEQNYSQRVTAKGMAYNLVGACRQLYAEKPGDDATVAVARLREREYVNVMAGLPEDPLEAEKMADDFLSCAGKKVVCGGTTSGIVAGHMGEKVEAETDFIDTGIPPIARIKGIDLVTEGVLTINRAFEIVRDYSRPSEEEADLSLRDGATRLARLLLEDATDIRFFAGTAVNPAHKDHAFPERLAHKAQLISELAENLKKLEKRVQVIYY